MTRSPLVGLQAIDPHRLVRQALPDRQQQPRDDVEIAVGKGRNLDEFPLPGFGEGDAIGPFPVRLVQRRQATCAVRSIGRSRRTRRSTSPSSSMTLGAGNLHGRTAGLGVHQQDRTRLIRTIQRLGERERPIALRAGGW